MSYYGLYALQHRGQESAGIVTCQAGKFRQRRAMGLVSQVFASSDLDYLKGEMAIGHTRYSTTGASSLDNAQPLTGDCGLGKVAVAHNGNLTNAQDLRRELKARGSIFQTNVDSEIFLHLLAQSSGNDISRRLSNALPNAKGAYSLVMMTSNELLGMRDPFGFRPLSLGKVEGAYVLSSETCAFDLIGASFIRDVEPGEIIVINQDGIKSTNAFSSHQRRALCVFEFVYFARPDSKLSGQNVYAVRMEMGRQLAKEHPVNADIVAPVPDSGNYAALGYSLESGIAHQMAFVRNHYVGRSFLQPSQSIRDFNVKVKLNLVPDLVRGKRVIVVDDSIVRGTTSKARVSALKEAGAREVHIRVSCPPHLHPCWYGTDLPDRAEILAAQKSKEEICEYLDVDSLEYLSPEGMTEATGLSQNSFCMACYNGKYPTEEYESL